MTKGWIDNAQPFLNYIETWRLRLPTIKLHELCPKPDQTAIISVDVINGFCHQGPLASPRVKNIIAPIVTLFEKAWDQEMRKFLLIQDSHEEDALEFAQFPPHCIRDTHQSEPVPELKALPFFDEMIIFEKNSIHSALNTELNAWIQQHPEVSTYIVVGDCTDLCTYQLAMHLRLDANAKQIERKVVLPANCVDTYHISVKTAEEIGAIPHDGDLLHHIFLYSMMLNGIEVVAAIR